MHYMLVALFLMLTFQAQQIEKPSSLIREEKVIGHTNEGITEIQVTEYERPPFYHGKLPLMYTTGKRDFSYSRLTLWADFGSFRNTFKLGAHRGIPGVGASIPGSARVTDSQGRLLAEAEVVKLTKDVGFEIEEIHYSRNGSPIFRCKSFIDFSGYKVKEVNSTGKKLREYFFLWPTGR